MARLPLALTFFALVAVGCSPSTSGIDTTPHDLAQTTRDLERDCTAPTNNRLQNPSFEMDSGTANNMGSPASTIGSWDGCCSTGGTTQWAVTDTTPRCGKRSIQVTSTAAQAHVLSQAITSPGDVGKQFQLTGWVFVTALNSTGSIQLDVFDLTGSRVIASTVALTTTSSDWVQLSQTAAVPTGGSFQVRINSSGNVAAYADDLSLVIP